MWIEESEIKALAEHIQTLFGLDVTVEENEKNKTITFKLKSHKPYLEALIKEVVPNIFLASPMKYQEKKEGEEGYRYKVDFDTFIQFKHWVTEDARSLTTKIYQLENFLYDKIVGKED